MSNLMNNLKVVSAYIDLHAIQHNYQLVKSLAPNSQAFAVIKADAYGHGIEQVVNILSEADAFAIARLTSALTLRKQCPQKPLLVLSGVHTEQAVLSHIEQNIQMMIYCEEQIALLEQLSEQYKNCLTVWLKIDTGMHRLGVREEQFEALYNRLQQCRIVKGNINLCSHFGCADEAGHPMTQQQIQTFNQLTHDKEGMKSLAASAAILTHPDSHLDWVRPGLMLYGVSPLEGKSAKALGLIPAMTLKAPLISVRKHKQGEPVGYGASWESPHDTKLGVIAIGYGDGYPRNAPEGTPVYINGRIVPIVGRVSMDLMTVDLGADATDKVGDEAILWGEQLPVEIVASHIGTIAYELVTKLTQRVHKYYVEPSDD